MDRFHTIHLIEGKTSRRIHVVREQIDQTANNIKAWSFSVRNLEKYVKKLKNEGESKIGRQVKNQSSTMSEDFEVFISLNLKMRNSRRSSKVHGDNWKSQRRLFGFVIGWMAESTGRPVARMMITSQNWRVSWKHRNPRECVWKKLHQKFMKTTLQEEGHSLQHYNLVHKLTPMPQAMKIPEAKAAVDKEWEKLEKISAWDLANVRNKSDVINEARKKGRESTFCVIDGSLSSQECWVREETPEV